MESVEFYDIYAQSKGIFMIRNFEDHIGITFSLETNGDVDIFLTEEKCTQLIKGLQIAIENTKR